MEQCVTMRKRFRRIMATIWYKIFDKIFISRRKVFRGDSKEFLILLYIKPGSEVSDLTLMGHSNFVFCFFWFFFE